MLSITLDHEKGSKGSGGGREKRKITGKEERKWKKKSIHTKHIWS